MHFSRAFLAAVFTALAAAQTENGPNSFDVPETGAYVLNAGQPQTFTWSNQVGDTVTLRLRYGNSGDLDEGGDIVSNLDNTGTYTWDVPSDIPRGTSYTVEIINDQDESQVNYTPPFTINSDVTGTPGLPGDDQDDDDDSSTTTGGSTTITSSASTSSATDSSSTSASTTDDDDSSTTTSSGTSTSSTGEPTPTSGMSEVPGEDDNGNAAPAVQVGASLLAAFGAMLAVM